MVFNDLPDKQVLTPKELAETWETTENALAVMRSRKTGPRYVKLNGKTVCYHRKDVEEWLRYGVDGRPSDEDAA